MESQSLHSAAWSLMMFDARLPCMLRLGHGAGHDGRQILCQETVLKTVHWQWTTCGKPMENKLSRLVPIEERDRLWVYCVELGSGKQDTKLESSWVWCLSVFSQPQNRWAELLIFAPKLQQKCEKKSTFEKIRPDFFQKIQVLGIGTPWVLRSPWSLSDPLKTRKMCRSVWKKSWFVAGTLNNPVF